MNMQVRNIDMHASFRLNQFGRGAVQLQSRTNQPLEIDQIRRSCPAVFAEDKHDSRSERYTYIPTIAVLEGLMREGFHPFSVMQGGSGDIDRRGYTKHMVRMRSSNPLSVGDTYYEVCLLNGHDGSCSYQLFGGLFRLICLNGMCVADSQVQAIKVFHRGNVVHDVIEGTHMIADQGQRVAAHVLNFRGIQLNRDEQDAFAEAALVARFGDEDRPAIQARQLLHARRSDDQGNDLWRTFNRVQENVTHGGIGYHAQNQNGSIAHRHTRPVQSIGADVKLNRALWVLAEKMAELKSAA